MAGIFSDILRQKWKVAKQKIKTITSGQKVSEEGRSHSDVYAGEAGEWAAAAIALSVVFISGGCHGKSMLALFRILPQASLASFRTSNTQRALSRHTIYVPSKDALAVKHGQGECQRNFFKFEPAKLYTWRHFLFGNAVHGHNLTLCPR